MISASPKNKVVGFLLLLGAGFISQANAYDLGTIPSTFTVIESTIIASGFVFNFGQASPVILKIDSDGDIFLRGKWIGFDARLSNNYRLRQK